MSGFVEAIPHVGNDPEVFLQDDGKVIPAESIGLSTKLSTSGNTRGSGIKADNIAVELNLDPATCLQTLNANIADGLLCLKKKIVDEMDTQKPSTKVLISPAAFIDLNFLKKYKTLREFGCQPSLVCHNGEIMVSIPKADPMSTPIRSTGFHVHLGMSKPRKIKKENYAEYDEEFLTDNKASEVVHSEEGKIRLVQMCDLVVGLPAVMLERNEELVKNRRSILGYGQAGEYREQPHGFEYRTLGPWPMLHPIWAWWANASVRDALHLVVNDVDGSIIKKMDMSEVSRIINEGDFAGAVRTWPQIKRLISDVVKSNNTWWDGVHPILSAKNLMKLEYLISKGGIKALGTGETFSFDNWGIKQNRDPWNFKILEGYKLKLSACMIGFPSGTGYRLRSTDYQSFKNKWEVEKDNLSSRVL